MSGLSRRTIQYWIETGELSAIYVGRKCRIHRGSFMAYMKRRNNVHQ
ncbi:MAG: helix-turn-helix domain-containing protein [Blastocatellia bacterium]|nr:helix-turn-helix domain-containing protein [Blastocatellia bacterium]